MPKFSSFTFASTNGKTDINVRRFDPDAAPRGVVQIAHGVAEHCERYDGFMTFLADHGFVAVANDHLGHGKSYKRIDEQGWFAESDGWDLVVGDVKKLHDMMKKEFPDLPYILFGHSMGSFVARTYLIKYPGDLDAAIICGTGQQAPALVTAGKAAAILTCRTRGSSRRSKMLNDMAFGSYNREFEPRRTDFDWLTRDNAVVDAYIKDPNCGFAATAGLFRDMMTGIEFISKPENIAKMNKSLPVFFISGDKDPVGENGAGPKKAVEMWKSAGMKDVTLKLYPDCRHELLNELNRDEVMGDILKFIESKI